MFGWFKRRTLPGPPAGSEPRDWANMRGEINGRPAFIRIRTSLSQPAARMGYDHEITAQIAFHELQDNGLPASDEELTAVDELEDWIKAHLESASPSVLGLVITGSGVRVCYFYSADPQAAIRVWETQLQPHIGGQQVTFQIRPDAQWQMYRRFLG